MSQAYQADTQLLQSTVGQLSGNVMPRPHVHESSQGLQGEIVVSPAIYRACQLDGGETVPPYPGLSRQRRWQCSQQGTATVTVNATP